MLSFHSNKMDPADSFTSTAAGVVVKHIYTPSVSSKLSSAAKIDAVSDANFLKQLFTFEKFCGKQVVLTAFQKSRYPP